MDEVTKMALHLLSAALVSSAGAMLTEFVLSARYRLLLRESICESVVVPMLCHLRLDVHSQEPESLRVATCVKYPDGEMSSTMVSVNLPWPSGYRRARFLIDHAETEIEVIGPGRHELKILANGAPLTAVPFNVVWSDELLGPRKITRGEMAARQQLYFPD